MGLWALDERKERLERAREEGREEVAKEYRQKLALAAREREDALAAARERANVIAAVVEEYELMIEEARERAWAEGIDLDRFLRRPKNGAARYGGRGC